MKVNETFILIVLLLMITGVAGFLGYRDYVLIQNKLALEQNLSATTDLLNNDIKALSTVIVTTKEDLATTTAQLYESNGALNECQAKYTSTVNDLGQQVSEAQTTIGTLKKLSETDPELLKKYSKVFFLSENYVPASLTKIDPGYVYNTKTDLLFYSETLPFLNVLMSTAQVDKIDIKVISAYRSFGTQSGLKSSYKVTYGTGANKFSADQGYSEHQLGTAVDFTTSTVGDSFTGFEKTPAYQWLVDNAYNYGFIMSYPKGNAYYQYEPWHWRFVGRALAQKLHDEGKNFYDLDQRDIDQYLISFFD